MPKEKTIDFKIGDEIWWFKIRNKNDSMGYCFNLSPGDIELVHDQIKEINNESLICWHCVRYAEGVWGKSRQEAWSNLKKDLEKWGHLV